jgi:hypothetical protein
MRISKHIITQMQKALVTYGINVPVTGEFDAKLQQAYVDWAGRNEVQGCILYPITDAQVSVKLLALADAVVPTAQVEALDTSETQSESTEETDSDVDLATLEATALREAEEAKAATAKAESISKWAEKSIEKAQVEQAQADAAQAELVAVKAQKKAL